MSDVENRTIRVVVSEDVDYQHMTFVRELSALKDIEIVGEAWNPDEALVVVTRMQPDVVLFDLKYTGWDWDPEAACAAIREMRSASPRTRVLALTAYGSEYGEAARKAGCDRILEKERGVGIRQVHDAIVALGNRPRERILSWQDIGLTPAEVRAFLAHARTGRKSEAARRRNVKPTTQRHQEQTIREKMAAHFGQPVPNMVKAIALAVEHGLIDRDTFANCVGDEM